MTVLTENPHAGNFILSEDDEGRLSRDEVVIAAGAGRLFPGTVLGKRLSDGAFDASAAARAGNTSNGTLTLGSPKTGARAKPGVYTVVCTAGGAAAKFRVEDPDGIEVGEATVATPFAGPVQFTIAAGAADFAAGDAFDITVTQTQASNKYVASPATAGDGSDRAVAVLVNEVDATNADVTAVAIARHAEVNRYGLLYDPSIDDDVKKSAKWDELRAAGIVVR
jgi:hypothetical protein